MFMASEPASTPWDRIETMIHLIRGQRVMLDSDLARIYGVPTMRLNEQLRRNLKRFPRDFAFQLEAQELTNLKSQIAISSLHGGRRSRPWVFTEHGAIMLAGVLKSDRAVEMSVFVVRAFIQMREMIRGNRQLAAKLNELEQRVADHDAVIADLVTAIRKLLNPPEPELPSREIGFHVREQPAPYRVKVRRRGYSHA